MRIRKKLRESRLRTHLQIRAWLQPKLGKAGERLRLAGRIRLANIWARKHPKRTFACVTGTLSLLLVCSLVMNNSKPDGTDNAHGIGAIARWNPCSKASAPYSRTKACTVPRYRSWRTADGHPTELDSLIAMPRKTHGDSLRIVRQYRRLENIVKFINNRRT